MEQFRKTTPEAPLFTTTDNPGTEGERAALEKAIGKNAYLTIRQIKSIPASNQLRNQITK